ncbi:hypothetical protein F5B20DRAFT_449741 [Whalleya microplaca]|nr:hypothetical protein F5B20DRAFT_449741 [Whalleya microplaca]
MANSTESSYLNFKDLSLSHSQPRQEKGQPLVEASVSELPSHDQPIPTISKFLRAKGREWGVIRAQPGPLRLLDLPVDILRLIVKEVIHTNDLTSLALSNSTLYYLAIPHIYARFDIVWPDVSSPPSDGKGVDALTYGLATLCLGSKFSQRTRWLRGIGLGGVRKSPERLADNQYAKYTRKFSIGNGPRDWTSEYMVTKETGKMLGTLVALAVAKMVNLETFVWDMPTGVLSDVFMALASLQDHYPDGEHKLEKVWIRWHEHDSDSDASSAVSSPIQPLPPAPPLPPLASLPISSVGSTLPSDFYPSMTQPIRYSESHVEYPTFSILPTLKSLTVLDIDEPAYLDEMSVLIERSYKTLRELRVGISQKAQSAEFAQALDGSHLQQVDHNAQWPGESRIGIPRLGGVLGVLVGRIYDIRRGSATKGKTKQPPRSSLNDMQGSSSLDSGTVALDGALLNEPRPQGQTTSDQGSGTKQNTNAASEHRKRLDGKLQLRTLELERVSLSIQVCREAIDWSVLTSLTILDCAHHEALWRMLKRAFQPITPTHGSSAGTPTQYHLALKHIHTDITANALINLIRETLPPNSLEVLFLQDRRRAGIPEVTIDHIFKSAIKRHRSSLKKILLDSSDKSGEGRRWASWVLTSEMVSYITSGRMPNLRELAAAFDYKDWHPFLQRLPNIQQLRSLHIPHMLEHLIRAFEPKELALQIVDIITLRPEIQVCYVGIGRKCFEILEARANDNYDGASEVRVNGHHHQNDAIDLNDDDEDGVGGVGGGGGGGDADEETEVDDDMNDDDTNGNSTEDGFTEVSDDMESDTDSFQGDLLGSAMRFRLREILFYDDKVAIFKARHGKL